KIVSHIGRKTIIQALKSFGESIFNIQKQLHHKSDKSLRSYLST
ncbi:9131_t:CDS:1, partial [Funneliformis mosseae]